MNEQRIISAAEGRRCTEELVRSVPEPEFTDSWHPHSHAKVIDATMMAVEQLGITIQKKTYSLAANGLKMFGLWQVEEENGKFNCLGFRNSMDKSMSIGFISMLTVIVCTNQITHGEYFQLRRHTSGLDTNMLSKLTAEAIGKVSQDFKVSQQWHEDLKGTKISREFGEQLTVQAMRIDGVLSPSKFAEFDQLFFGNDSIESEYDSTLYGFHGALTQIIRDQSYGRNVLMNQQITAFVNSVRSH